jgi:hypothetical protein
MGQLAKTDSIDAEVLAKFAQVEIWGHHTNFL